MTGVQGHSTSADGVGLPWGWEALPLQGSIFSLCPSSHGQAQAGGTNHMPHSGLKILESAPEGMLNIHEGLCKYHFHQSRDGSFDPELELRPKQESGVPSEETN